MTVWKLPEIQKKPNRTDWDSRFHGNDGILGFFFDFLFFAGMAVWKLPEIQKKRTETGRIGFPPARE
ncbi:hypothetical protein F7O61_11090 [Neisseria meningitidis]|nr:hypothetical protein [Neisseria meningitidis]